MLCFLFLFFIFRADTGLFLFNLIFENFSLHIFLIIIYKYSMFRDVACSFIDARCEVDQIIRVARQITAVINHTRPSAEKRLDKTLVLSRRFCAEGRV